MEHGDGPDPEPGLTPEEVEGTEFSTVRRGLEPGPVRTRLREAADEIRRLKALVDSLAGRVAELQDTPPATLESHRVAEALGDEATRVLQSASDAAQERIERAEAEYNDIVARAQAAATAVLEEGREQGREMVIEARNVRERILTDLARRRHGHRVEVEQLQVIRDRFLEAIDICRQGLDGWIEELIETEPRAVAAAQRAGQRIAAEPEQTVGEIEAEIDSARRVGASLDREPEEAESGEGTRAGDAELEQAERHEQASDAGKVATPSAALDDAESDGLEDLDELDDPSEYVEIVGCTDKPSLAPSAATAARLYDIEAEADTEADADSESDTADGPPGAQAPEPSDGASSAPTEAFELDVEAAESGADAIFARLRSITTRPVDDQLEPPQAAPPATGNGATPTDEVGAAPQHAAPESAAEEFAAPEHAAEDLAAASTWAESAAGADEPFDPDDLVSAARAVAVGGIARRLKRLVVDEQGDLLDAIRRNGARAVRSTVAADTRVYTRAARVPMQDFASDIDVSIDDIDLQAAGEAIVSVLVEPVRTRLGELADDTDDLDELSSAVRSIYRESRSRRAESAAEAAFSAGWPETIT